MAQAEPKLFRIRRRASTGGMWKFASAALAAVAPGTGAFGYVQYDTVRTLRARLAQATGKANQAGAEEVKLGSQLSTAQDRINSQATKLTAAKQEASLEQHELDEAQQQATAEQLQLAAAKRQVEEEKRELRDARMQLAAESRPDLPVRVFLSTLLVSEQRRSCCRTSRMPSWM